MRRRGLAALALGVITLVIAGASPASAKLPTPVVTAAVHSGGEVTFEWNHVEGRAEYHIQYWRPSGHNVYGATEETSFSVPVNGEFGQFCLEVRAVYPGQDSDLSNRLCTEVTDDSEPPSRPGFGDYSVNVDSTTFRWTASTDDTGVVGYRARLWGTAFDVTLPADARSHTFTEVAARTSRYLWDVRAIDAAGNTSAPRRATVRVLSEAESAASAQAVDDVLAALEAWAGDKDSYTGYGGNNGQGWFNHSNASSYPEKMAAVLIDNGYLTEEYRDIFYWDLMVYRCGTGTDDERIAVFSTAHTTSTDADDQARWAGCNQNPIMRYGHDHYRVSRTIAEVRADAVDTEAPSRPGWGTSYWAVGPDAIFLSWGESTDNIEVTGYRVKVSNEVDTTLSRWTRSHIVSGLDPGRYIVRVAAVDAAGNQSSWRSVWLRVDTAADRQAARDDAEQILTALEAYARRHGTFRVDGGARGEGYGWFNHSNASGTYPSKISEALIDEGLLGPEFADDNYGDYMIYHCGSGDARRVGVFTEDGATDAASADADAWNGCTATPRRYGKNYYRVSVQLDELAGTDTQAPSTVSATPESATYNSIRITWPAATDNVGVDGYEIVVDGVVEATLTDAARRYTLDGLSRATLYGVGVVAFDAAGNRSSVNNVLMGTTATIPLPSVRPTVESVTGTSMRLTWEVPATDANLEAIGIFIDGENQIWIPATETSFTVADWSIGSALTPDTEYSVGVYVVEADYVTRDLEDDVVVSTALGDEPPTQPAIGLWERTDDSITVKWGYSDNGVPVPADDTDGVWYSVIVNGQPLGVVDTNDDRSHTLSGLFSDTEYTIAVVATDADGLATSSPTLTVRTLPPSPPPTVAPQPAPDTQAPIWGSGVSAPTIASDDLVAPGSVLISWCCALDYDQYNVVPASFDVYFKRANAATYQLLRNVLADNTSGSTVLSGLTQGVEYSVAVVAIDRAGNRSDALERRGVVASGGPPPPRQDPPPGQIATDPNPQPPVQNPPNVPVYEDPGFTLPALVIDEVDDSWACGGAGFEYRVSEDSVEVSWARGANGVTLVYGAALDPDTRAFRGLLASTRSGPGPDSVVVMGLVPSTNYLIKLMAFNASNERIGECFVPVTTDDPFQPEVLIPPCIATVDFAGTSVLVNWSIVRDGSGNEPSRYRVLLYEDTGLGLTTAEAYSAVYTDTAPSPDGTRSALFNNLELGADYVVTVTPLYTSPPSYRQDCQVGFRTQEADTCQGATDTNAGRDCSVFKTESFIDGYGSEYVFNAWGSSREDGYRYEVDLGVYACGENTTEECEIGFRAGFRAFYVGISGGAIEWTGSTRCTSPPFDSNHGAYVCKLETPRLTFPQYDRDRCAGVARVRIYDDRNFLVYTNVISSKSVICNPYG